MKRLFAVANNNVLNAQHIEVLQKKRLLLFNYINKLGIVNYNALIRSADADQLLECEGKVAAVLCGSGSDDLKSQVITISVKSFDAVLPRKRWTHIAIVSSDKQNANRLTMYMVRMDGRIFSWNSPQSYFRYVGWRYHQKHERKQFSDANGFSVWLWEWCKYEWYYSILLCIN